MAMLRLKCYACGAIMPTPESKAGKKARCPACDAPLRIPPAHAFNMFDGQKVMALKEPEWKGRAAAPPSQPAKGEDWIGRPEKPEENPEDDLLVARGPGEAGSGDDAPSPADTTPPPPAADDPFDEDDLFRPLDDD